MDKKSSTISLPIVTILFTIMGYFVFGGVSGALAVLGFCIVLSICQLLSLIPYLVGTLVYILLTMFWLNEAWFQLTGIFFNWLIGLIWVSHFILSAFISVLVTIKINEL